VGPDTPSITEDQAEQQLAERMDELGGYIEKYIRVSISDNEYAALVSLTYNAGTGPLTGGLGKVLNRGDRISASEHFQYWNKAHVNGGLVPLAGLTRRREAEKQLFLTPDEEPATHNID
jgi:lysozyme